MDVAKLLMKASEDLSVRRAFGAAYEKDDMLIIPVAMVAGGGGGGAGRSRQRQLAAGPDGVPAVNPGHEPAPQDSEPMDTGGGFGGLVMPTGAYVVKGGQVRWVPAVDIRVVVLASLGLVRVLAHAWTRSRRNHGEP